MLVGLREVTAYAEKTGTAIGAINTPNHENLWAALDAAEALNIPLILAHVQLHESVAPLDRIGPAMVALAKASKVPVCVHLDHGEDFGYIRRAIELGFTSAMIDYSCLPYEENVAGTREVVEYAHKRGVDVEAELGALPQREGGGEAAADPKALYTKPGLVPDFVERTGVDALAIAFGTAHGIYKSTPVLDFNVIAEVRKKTDVPLVMHGGSGIGHDDYRKAISCGIRKINYYSYMSYDGYVAAKAVVQEVPADFYHNLAKAAQQAMYENLYATLKVFSGK